MSWLDRMFGGFVPEDTDERDREALLRQLYMSMGAQLIGSGASGQGFGEGLSGMLQQLQTIPAQARALQDRRSQQEYYELQRQIMREDAERKRQLHPLNLETNQEQLEAAKMANDVNARNVAKTESEAWKADEDITIANDQRVKFLKEMEVALASTERNMAPEQANELRARLGEIKSVPNEAITTAWLREQRANFYKDAEAYTRGERTFNESVRRANQDDSRMWRALEFKQGNPKVSRVTGGKHIMLTYPDGSVEYQALPEEVNQGVVDQTGALAAAREQGKQSVTDNEGKEVTPQMMQAAVVRARKAIADEMNYRSVSQLTAKDEARAEALAMAELKLSKEGYDRLKGGEANKMKEFLDMLGSAINQ